jgi:hypothetical protein
MAQIDSVSQNTQDYFGNYRLIKSSNPVSLATTGNAVIALPILGGGTGGTTQYVLRRITVSVLSNIAGGSAPNAATANISVGTTNDGGNLIASGQTLTNLTSATTYQDLTLASGTLATTYTANALFVNVNTGVANAQAYVTVYGDIQTF